MKKILAILLALLMCTAVFVACGSDEPAKEKNEGSKTAANSDLADIVAKGKLVVGITDFAPMDYKADNGEWIGFDADMAKAFAEYIGVDVEFQEIVWDNKVLELDSKTIDVVWNGMTLTDEVLAAMECSNAYCDNAQVVVISSSIAGDYLDAESLKTLTFAVEEGSAGEKEAKARGFETVPAADQASALLEVESGNADAAIIDSLMAGAMIGEGTSYEDLEATVALNSEKYGVGFRKGSDAAAKLNEFFKKSYEDGTMMETANKYGVQTAVVAQ